MKVERTPASAAAQPAVRAVVAPALELLAGIWAFLDREHYPLYDVGEAWFETVARDAEQLAGELRGFAGGSSMVWDHVVGVSLDAGAPYEVDRLDAALEALSDEELLGRLLGSESREVVRRVTPDTVLAAARGDAEARQALRRRAFPDDPSWQAGIRWLLRTDAASIRTQLRSIIAAWHDCVFAGYAGAVLPLLAADAAATQQAILAGPALDVVRERLSGTPYEPTPDVRDVLLAPSFIARPFVYYFPHATTMAFLYPADGLPEGIGGVPRHGRLLRVAKALGDEVRLEILERLRDGERSVRELTDQMGLPRSTLRHHLGILYSAGLIRPSRFGSGPWRYQLRESALPDLAELLERLVNP